MHFTSTMTRWDLFAVALAVTAAAAQDDPSPIGAQLSGGVLQIFGNSFGRPGFNDTFDYVVCLTSILHFICFGDSRVDVDIVNRSWEVAMLEAPSPHV